MASDPELKPSTFGLPQWMKNKPSANKDFESPFSGSPPPIEDPFFYINYPATSLTKAKKTEESKPPSGVTESIQAKVDKDWSKHTKPCRNVLHGLDPITTAANPIAVKATNQQVVEEALNSEACGTSLVKVAHKMVSSGRSATNRGFTVATPSDDNISSNDRPESPLKPDIDLGQYQLSRRRGSRSLPASPNTSPSSRRKTYGNKYFTSPFEPVLDDSKPKSWLSMALLGFRKDLSASTNTLHEEESGVSVQKPSLLQSVENLYSHPSSNNNVNTEAVKIDTSSNEQQSATPKPKPTFRPVPSEFRELNFWSPTSM